MEKANPQHVSKRIADKFCSLLTTLNKSTEAFEDNASTLKDKSLKETFMSIAMESNQYAHELSSQLQSLGIEKLAPPETFNCDELVNNIHSAATAPSPKSMLDAWNKSESLFEKAYRDALNEYCPYQGLRKIISYQLNGIKCAFMKMRLTNELLYNYE